MKTCCQELQDIKCSIPDINERIAPIEYINNNLVVNTTVSVKTNFTIGGAGISTETGHLDLPARTLINGVPLLSDAFLTDVINLPSDTISNGYFPTIEQYFYFFMASNTTTDLNPSPNGYIINGTTSTTGTPTVDMRAFPFIAPEDCVLTSLKLIYIIVPGTGLSTPGNGRVSLDVIDQNLNPFFTGISYDIVAASSNSCTLFQSQFEYYLRKGDSVGIYVNGSASESNGGVSIYATLGFRIIPSSLLLTNFTNTTKMVSLRNSSVSIYNRFPFNKIMNFHRRFPISFEEQLEMLRLKQFSTEKLYGRKLTTQDYELRSKFSI